MWFRCLVLLFCLTAICAQKGGRQASASEGRPVQRSPSRIWAGRKVPEASEPIQQVAQEPEDDRDPEEDREVVVAARPQRPRILPPPSRPQPAESDPGGHPAPEPYSFSYSVDDPETGAASSREETQDANGEIVGFYHLRDADGRMRRVDYTAGKDGFKASIKSNEEGLNARAPADVNIELSASPSESRASYAPNNRPQQQPTASESSIKSYGRPPSERFFQRLIPLPAPIAPLPAPPTQETSRIEQVVEQRTEDPPQEAQISQQYETSEQSDPQEIVQQRNVDVEEAFESAPPQPLPPVKGPQVVFQQAPRPVANFQPLRIQSFREQGGVSIQPLSIPIAQVREEIPNTIQDPQPPASTKTIPTVSVSQPAYPAFRPLAPVISEPVVQVSRPVPQVQPQFTQYYERGPAVQTIQQSVPNLAPISPPSNNIVLQHREHREPISQERLLNYFHPGPSHTHIPVQNQEIVITPPPAQPLEVSYPYYEPQQQINFQPVSGGYNLVVNHREVQTPRQEVITQERIVEPQRIQTEIRSASQVRELVPPPAPQPLPQINIQSNAFEYRPLPALSQPVQRQEQSFEPQTYEPLQQTYEPLQQEAEDPAEESRVEPPCKCLDQAATVPAEVKSGPSAPSEPQPIKSGRLSPARAFIPQAFRSS